MGPSVRRRVSSSCRRVPRVTLAVIGQTDGGRYAVQPGGTSAFGSTGARARPGHSKQSLGEFCFSGRWGSARLTDSLVPPCMAGRGQEEATEPPEVAATSLREGTSEKRKIPAMFYLPYGGLSRDRCRQQASSAGRSLEGGGNALGRMMNSADYKLNSRNPCQMPHEDSLE